MSDPEWVTLEVLLKHGEYPIVTNLIQLGQTVNNAIFFIQRFEPGKAPVQSENIERALSAMRKLKSDIDVAVAKETGLKIERRICQR